jgi:hypothetical protein
MLSPTAWADQIHKVQFNFSAVQSGASNLSAPRGGPVSDSGVPIDQMQGEVEDGVFGPVVISGGALNFATPNPTSVADFPPGYFNYYAAGGGSLTLTGSVFSLPAGSSLLTATFAPAIPPPYPSTSNVFVDPTSGLTEFTGLLNVTWVNPMLLSDLGAGGISYVGFGNMDVTQSRNTDGSLNTETGITAILFVTPEPGTARLLGTALLGVGLLGLTARRWAGGRRTAV